MNQNAEPKHFQLPTETCWSHTWRQPALQFLPSRHYNGAQFFNPVPAPEGRSRNDLLKWLWQRKRTWSVEAAQAQRSSEGKCPLPQERPQASLDDWQVWFVGHATVLIQIGPYNFLTDPVWAEYAGPQQGKGPQRICPAGIALEELPTIHAVLLSHNHYDHMDLATLRWLHERFAMPIYTGLGNSWYLPKNFHVVEMDWWQSALFNELKLVYVPAQHGSGRGMRDQNCALWGGFSILHDENHCFFAGDTGYSSHFKEIHARIGAPRIALLPIAAYEANALMRYMHMNAEDAFQAHKDLHSKCSLAVHYRTFQLTNEERDQPEADLQKAMRKSSKLMNPFYCITEGKKLIV